MKHFLTLILFITSSFYSYAQPRINGLKKVPTLIKTTSTFILTNDVRSSIAEKWIYVNNKEKQYIRMNYEMTDTVYRNTNYYDKNGYLVQDRTEEYSNQLHKLGFSRRSKYYYSDNYRNLCRVNEYGNWSGTTWFDNYKHTILKDTNNNVIFDGGETYNYDFHKWDTSFTKYVYEYFPNSTLIKNKTELWYIGNNKYKTKYQSKFEYDSLDRIVKLSDYQLNPDSNTWTIDFMTTYEYQKNEVNPFTITSNYMLADTIYGSLRCDSLRWTYFDKTLPMTAEYIRSVNQINKENVLAYDMQRKWMSSGNWEMIYKTKLTDIDNFGSTKRSSFNIYNNKYVPNTNVYTIRDSQGKIIDENYDKFDTTTKSWTNFNIGKYTYLYNPDNTIMECIVVKDGYRHRYEYSDYVEISTGITKDELTSLSIYPNPSPDGTVYIKYDSQKETTLKIDVLDINGKTIVTEYHKSNQGLNSIELNGLNKGMYFVILTSDYGVSRTKLLVR